MKTNNTRLISRQSLIVALSVLLMLLGIMLRYKGLEFMSIDMKGFLFNWYDEMALNGFSSLREGFSNYTPPYLYLLGIAAMTQTFLPKIISIKLVSILFDLLNAFIFYKILVIKYPSQKTTALLGSAIFLVLPTILLNSSYWGQADAIYTFFVLVCLYCVLTNRPLLAIISFGISFSFKAQSVFLLPFLALLIIKKRIPWYYLGIIPLVYIIMITPALMAGRSFMDLISIYINQANSYHFLTLASPNIYVFISNKLYDPVMKIGIVATIIIAAVWITIYTHRIKKITSDAIVLSALISVVIIPFFLPKMHDRYFYLADVLSLLAAFYINGMWLFALGCQITSGIVYAIFLLFPQTIPFKETMLITAAMINTALTGALLYVQWNLTNANSSSPVNENIIKQDIPMNSNPLRASVLNQLTTFISRIGPYLPFMLIFAVGIAARLWEFRSLPPGLNPDEASIGVEAYYLYKYGVDRNGMSYPVHLISWGSGQNALYAYLILPLIALKGLNAMSIRIPMLLSGILSMPLIYFAGKKMFGKKFGLIAMFFMAISPWHIVNSRWAVESNILPFFLLAGFTLLLFSSQKNYLFIFACIFFAVSLYAYGTAYVGVPIFLSLTIPVLIYVKQITIKQAIIGLTVFFVLALPIALFVIINTFHLDTIRLGLISIPRMPVQARYEAMAAVFGNSPWQAMSENIGIMLKMLWSQEDAYPWNYVKPFGYFYKITFPFALIGLLLTIPLRSNSEKKVERWFLTSWMIASIAIGVIHPTNLTRLNFIFTPILFFIAIFVFELDKHVKYSLAITVLALSIGFVLFTQAYHGEEYRKRAGGVFNSGLIPAIEYAADNGKSSICFTESIYSSYIYVLFAQKMHPSEYINDVEWLYPSDPADPARTPREIGRYHFRLSDCSGDPDAAYILLQKKSPPSEGIKYKLKKFNKFEVYLPK